MVRYVASRKLSELGFEREQLNDGGSEGIACNTTSQWPNRTRDFAAESRPPLSYTRVKFNIIEVGVAIKLFETKSTGFSVDAQWKLFAV